MTTEFLYLFQKGKGNSFSITCLKGKPHKTKRINVPQEAGSITGNQQNVPSDHFEIFIVQCHPV